MFSRSRKHTYFKFGRCEQLEDRNMLAAHPFAAFPVAGHFILSPVAAIQGGHQAGTAARHADNGGGDYSSSQQTTFTATLTDPNSTTATGTATYTTNTMCGTTSSSLSVSVTGMPPARR